MVVGGYGFGEIVTGINLTTDGRLNYGTTWFIFSNTFKKKILVSDV